MKRSDKLGYYAPIEVYDNKYYRYSDPNYSIMNMPMSQNDYLLMQEAVDMLRQLQDFDQFAEVSDVVSRLQDRLAITQKNRKPVIHFDSVPGLKGLRFLNPLYNHIVCQQALRIQYQPYKRQRPKLLTVYPYLLKEFRNRWFLFASKCEDMSLLTLALDRIASVEVAADIAWQENLEFDTEHYFDDIIGVTKPINAKLQVITFWASPTTCKYIQTKPLHHSQQLLVENEDGSCIFQIEVVINYEMFSVFMGYGPGIRILSPKKTADYIKGQLLESVKLYTDMI